MELSCGGRRSGIDGPAFCDVIIKNTGGEERDHFWDSAEMNLLKALVLYVSTSYPKKSRISARCIS